MRLTTEQQDELKSERGIFANEVCDECKAVLGSVRFTRRSKPGEWCSEKCRDGIKATTMSEERRVLLHRKYATVGERTAARRRADRERKASRTVQTTAISA